MSTSTAMVVHMTLDFYSKHKHNNSSIWLEENTEPQNKNGLEILNDSNSLRYDC
jgi:hypothetical protein